MWISARATWRYSASYLRFRSILSQTRQKAKTKVSLNKKSLVGGTHAEITAALSSCKNFRSDHRSIFSLTLNFTLNISFQKIGHHVGITALSTVKLDSYYIFEIFFQNRSYVCFGLKAFIIRWLSMNPSCFFCFSNVWLRLGWIIVSALFIFILDFSHWEISKFDYSIDLSKS